MEVGIIESDMLVVVMSLLGVIPVDDDKLELVRLPTMWGCVMQNV